MFSSSLVAILLQTPLYSHSPCTNNQTTMWPMKNIDQYYMQQTLALANRAKLTVSPNPMVGCVIVKNGAIISEGWHEFTSGNHAEINALITAGSNAKNSTVYVNLEPCCHMGKTGPCTQALIDAQVSRVVVATLDPNPLVAGNGIAILEDAGIKVSVGILGKQSRDLNKIFMHFQRNNRPFVFAKWAMSLDGQTTVNDNDSKQISSPKSKIYTHKLRNICDAIIVGKDTLIIDNPELDVRVKIDVVLQPIRLVAFSVIDNIDSNWKVLNQSVSKTIFVGTEITQTAKKELDELNIDVWIVNKNQNKPCLDTLLSQMGKYGITSLLVEGGRKLLNSFSDQKLINEYVSYISPIIIANSCPKQQLEYSNVGHLGQDILVNAKPQGCKYV